MLGKEAFSYLIPVDEGLKEHKGTSQFIGAILVKLGFIKEEELYPILSEQLNISYVKIKEANIDTSILKKVPAKFACHYKLMPLKFENNLLTVAVTDPLDIRTLDDPLYFYKYMVLFI